MSLYSFCTINKISNVGTLVSTYNHNYREVEVDNADPELIHLNEELVSLPLKEDGSRMRYDEVCSQRIASLPYYQNHGLRPGQNLCIEVILSYTKDDSIDAEQWKQDSVDWLHQYFDLAGDNKSNVISAMYHGDEAGNGHIHAIVVPIDERGHLNAKRYSDGSRALSNMQSSYADAVKHLGLERGLAGSAASHKTMRKLYANINDALNLPDPLEGESAEQYKQRILEDAETLYAVRTKAADDYSASTKRQADAYAIEQRDAAADELDKLRVLHASDIGALEKEKEKARLEADRAKAVADSYQAQVDMLTTQIWQLKTTMEITKTVQANAKKAAYIQAGLEIIKAEDPDRGERLEEDIEYAVSRAKDRESFQANALNPQSQEGAI